jgi:hypothetical protein
MKTQKKTHTDNINTHLVCLVIFCLDVSISHVQLPRELPAVVLRKIEALEDVAYLINLWRELTLHCRLRGPVAGGEHLGYKIYLAPVHVCVCVCEECELLFCKVQ